MWTRKEIGFVAALFVFAVGLYWPSTQNEFVLDDQVAVLRNPDALAQRDLAEIWKHDFWGTPLERVESHQSYRPLAVLSLRIDTLIGGSNHPPNPFIFRVHNVLLYAVLCVSFFFVSESLFGLTSPPTRVLCSLLFATHPIHTECVDSVVGRADLLSAVFLLWSLFGCVRLSSSKDVSHRSTIGGIVVSVFLYFAAAFSKETAAAVCAPLLFMFLFVFQFSSVGSDATGERVLRARAVFICTSHLF